MYISLVVIILVGAPIDAKPSWLGDLIQIPVPEPLSFLNILKDILQGPTTTTTTVRPVTTGNTANPVTLIGGPCARVCPGGEQQGAYCICKPIQTICRWFQFNC